MKLMVHTCAAGGSMLVLSRRNALVTVLAWMGLLCPAIAQAQTLFGYTYAGTPPSGVEQLGVINPASGSFTPLTTIASGEVFVMGVNAVDSAGHRFFLYASATPESSCTPGPPICNPGAPVCTPGPPSCPSAPTLLYTVNTSTGEVSVSNAATTTVIPAGIAFDENSGTLFGYAYIGTFPNGSEQLGAINPQTGVFTPLTTIASGGVFVKPGVQAMDSPGHHFYLYASATPASSCTPGPPVCTPGPPVCSPAPPFCTSGPPVCTPGALSCPFAPTLLYTVNTQTGAVSTSSPGTTGLAPADLAFDGKTATLYGVTPDGRETATQLGTINPQSGVFTPVALVAYSSSGIAAVPADAAIDSVCNRFFFYASVLNGPQLLYTVNLLSGGVSMASGPTSPYGAGIGYESAPFRIDSLTANPNVLWPPDHKLVAVTVAAATSGNCSAVTCKIVSVTSNESIAPEDAVITGNLTVNLRAERSGDGRGRVYTITVQCTDAAGNVTTKTVTVTVPHDQGSGNSGPGGENGE